MTPEDAHIAIIGLACRFPGADDPEGFWSNLVGGVDSVTHLASGSGGFLTDPEWFDADYFGYSPREARIIDPQHRVFLECVVQALENAGCDPARHPGSIGVYAGGTDTPYGAVLRAARPPGVTDWEIRVATGADFLGSRAAYKLGLRGPAVTVRAACATSLVAVHTAAQALLAGDCDLALAGGVSVHVPAVPSRYVEGGIISPDGVCRTFDAAAQGIVGGDGAGLVVLKRLPEARADGDRIRAVIRGSAVNNDGSDRAGYTAPGVEGQAAVIRAAQRIADVDPETVTYVEAHGTATPIGDPIEVTALTKAFGTARRGYCAIGSVKTNFGHTDAAAGVAGLIKTVLALEHGIIPPSLHFSEPNPQIDFEASPFHVVTRPTPWPGPRRAGVSSFGMGGTNAHVVLDGPPADERSSRLPGPHLLVLSAKTPAALDEVAAGLAAHLQAHPDEPLADVAWTLQTGRTHHAHRHYVLVDGHEDAVLALTGRQDPLKVSEAGRQWAAGEPVVWDGGGRRKVPLPTYPFARRRHVVDLADLQEGASAPPRDDPAPGGQVRQVVTGLFAEMLGLDDLDPDESFFDLGGDSLVATQLLVRLKRIYPVDVALRSMFEAPTANSFAALIEARTAGNGHG